MNQFSKKDKDHHVKVQDRAVSFEYLKALNNTDDKETIRTLEKQVFDIGLKYYYWKSKLSQVNKTLCSLKKLKTAYCKNYPDVSDLQHINERLFWWRSYYNLALREFKNAKYECNRAQRYFSRGKEKVNPHGIERLEYAEYKAKKEAELGESIRGFEVWYADAHRDVLEKQYHGSKAFDIVFYVLKKTYHYWDRFYQMYKQGMKTIPKGKPCPKD